MGRSCQPGRAGLADGVAELVEEVLQGGLGDPVGQEPVCWLAGGGLGGW